MLYRHLNLKKIIGLVLPIAWMIFIFGFSNQSAEESAELSGGVLAKLLEIFPFQITEHFVRKAAHFSEYTVLGILTANGVRWNFSGSYPRITVLICAIYSIADEVHQCFVPGRACLFTDMLLDTVGSAFGVLLIWLFLLLAERKCSGRFVKR